MPTAAHKKPAIRYPRRIDRISARKAGYGPLTIEYTSNEEHLLERALAPLLKDGIDTVLVCPLFSPWPAEIWRKGINLEGVNQGRVGVNGGQTASAPVAFRQWVKAEYQKRPAGTLESTFLSNLYARWRRWRDGDPSAAVPGYDTCPPPSVKCPTRPQGWSRIALLYTQHVN